MGQRYIGEIVLLVLPVARLDVNDNGARVQS